MLSLVLRASEQLNAKIKKKKKKYNSNYWDYYLNFLEFKLSV